MRSNKRLSYLKFLTVLFSIWQLTAATGPSWADSNALDYYQEGNNYQLREDYYKAIERYKAALVINPKYLQPLIGLAECFYQVKQYDEALRYIKQVQAYDKNNFAWRVKEARILTAFGELGQAEKILTTLLKAEPHNVDARLSLAELQLADGRKKHAAVQYLETLKIAPDNVEALLRLVLLYEELGDKGTAQTYLQRALKNYTEDPVVHYTAARYFFQKKDYTDAISHLNTTLLLKENYYEASQLLGNIYILLGDYPKAEETIRSNLQATDSDYLFDAKYTLGLVYEKELKYQEALHSFSEALRIRPGDELVRMAAENFCLKYPEETKDARLRYSRLHQLEGKKFEEMNQLDKALFEYRRSLQLDMFSRQARLGFANINKLTAFPIKYLMELLVLKNENQINEEIADNIAIGMEHLYQSLAQRWANRLDPFFGQEDEQKNKEDPYFDQYKIAKSTFSLAAFSLTDKNRMVHLNGDEELTTYFIALLDYFDIFKQPKHNPMAESFDAVFRQARELPSDYFLILRYDEAQRYLDLFASLYLTRTGTFIKDWHIYRTGNNRMQEALLMLAQKIQAEFPLRGNILARDLNKGVINLGRREGVKKANRFLIVKKGKLLLNTQKIDFSYREEDVLGEFSVTEADENLAEGVIKPQGFFDLINPEDEVIVMPEPLTTTKTPAKTPTK